VVGFFFGTIRMSQAITINGNDQGLPVEFLYRDGQTIVRLLESITYHTIAGPITVPAGFESDGCSMPRLFWRLFGHPFDMRYLREAILHDWLYWIQSFPRRDSDDIFRISLHVSGRLAEWRIEAIAFGLRLFGWIAWRANRRRRQRALRQG